MFIIIFIALINYHSSFAINGVNYCDSTLCPSNAKHIGCNHNNEFNQSCPADKAMLFLSNADIQQIVDNHNMLRNRIATGAEIGFKKAVKMQALAWNEELAYLASLNVKQCQMAHDQCRNTFQFKSVGQNLGFRANTMGFEGLSTFLNGVIWAWYNEIKDASQSNIDQCCGGGNFTKIGHFLQMVQDKATSIGCAVSRYTNGQWKTLLLGCNYSHGNLLSGAVYASGNATSGCPTSKNTKYPGLCN